MAPEMCRAGALDVDAAKAAGVQPGRSFGDLKAGRAVQSLSGEWVQPEQVLRTCIKAPAV